MPRKLSPEEATVMIIRRRLQQMEEAKMAEADSDDEQDALSEADSTEQGSDKESAKD